MALMRGFTEWDRKAWMRLEYILSCLTCGRYSKFTFMLVSPPFVMITYYARFGNRGEIDRNLHNRSYYLKLGGQSRSWSSPTAVQLLIPGEGEVTTVKIFKFTNCSTTLDSGGGGGDCSQDPEVHQLQSNFCLGGWLQSRIWSSPTAVRLLILGEVTSVKILKFTDCGSTSGSRGRGSDCSQESETFQLHSKF